MKTSIKAIVAATVVTLAWAAMAEDVPVTKAPATCPMMKKAGQCQMKQDAAAAAPAAVADQTAGTVKAQVTCPVMGGKINKDLFVDVEGKRIYVCCKGCIAAVEKDPALYLKKLQEAGVTPAATPETAPAK